MKYWIVIDSEGFEQRCITSGDDPASEGIVGTKISELPREMQSWEHWDWNKGEIVEDTKKRMADAESQVDFLSGMNPVRLEMLHYRKAIEAYTYQKSQDPNDAPLLSAEAEALEVDLSKLVQQVLANDTTSINAEVNRRKAKNAIRNKEFLEDQSLRLT